MVCFHRKLNKLCFGTLNKTAVFASFNELDQYNRPRKPRPHAPRPISDASDAPLEFSMLDDATSPEYDDEESENELEQMMEHSNSPPLPPVNIMVRGAKQRKIGLKNTKLYSSFSLFYQIF